MVQVSCRFAFAVDAPTGHRSSRHRHPCTEIVLMLSGDGVLHQDGAPQPYHAGTALIYQPGGDHWIAQHRPGRHLCLGLAGGIAPRLAPGVRSIPGEIEALTGLLVRELAGPRGQDRLDLLAGLAASYLAQAEPARTTGRAAGSAANHLAQADAVLRAHLDRPLGAGELADALFISAGYLRQLFHRAYGHGPMHRLLDLRIAHAKTLLASGPLPIGEVATRCGFVSQFHFSRVFRRVAGMPPSAWRRSSSA